jgi:nucleoside-diphosphate-sugar epimerase
VSDGALTLRGYAEALYRWRGHEPNISYLPWEAWKKERGEDHSAKTYDHAAHSPSCSMDKARRLLGYAPRWPSLEAVKQAVEWLAAHDFKME